MSNHTTPQDEQRYIVSHGGHRTSSYQQTVVSALSEKHAIDRGITDLNGISGRDAVGVREL